MPPVIVQTHHHIHGAPPPPPLSTTLNSSMNDSSLIGHLADFSVIRQTCLGIGFTDMDPESFEAVLKALPADINLNNITEARLYELCMDNGISLPRFPVNSVDFRVNYPKIADYYLGNKGKCKFVMSLRTQNKLWKSFSIHGRHFAPFDVFNVAKWITASGEVFRVNFFAVKFLSMKAMTDFIDFLQEARTDRYPPPVKIVFDSCEFTRISALNMRNVINRFVEECGVVGLSFTNVRYEDVEMLSKAVSWSKAYKLKKFAFHTIELTKTQAHLTKPLLKPFLNPHRCTEHVSINGFPLDMAQLFAFIVDICVKRRYLKVIPPKMRVALPISHEYTRAELHSLLCTASDGVVQYSDDHLTSNHCIHLELGMYEDIDLDLGLIHAVIDVEVEAVS